LRNFWLGLFVGALLGGGGVFLALRVKKAEPAPVAAAAPDAGPQPAPTKRRRRAVARAPAGDQPPPILTEADLRMGADGDPLHVGPRTIDLSSGEDVRDLTREEIDGAIAPRSEDIIACIVQARGPAELSGRVTVGLVVTARGSVSHARVEAPSYLLNKGLHRCVRPKLLALRFPATGKDTVVRVPFDVE
jgi:hypothetical protein